jgi:hypothetical protein
VPEDPNVEKFLAEEKALDNRKRALIDNVLRQKAEAVKGFDEQLAKLRYQDDGAKPRRSHQKKGAPLCNAREGAGSGEKTRSEILRLTQPPPSAAAERSGNRRRVARARRR